MLIAAIDPGTKETGLAVVEFTPAPVLRGSITIGRPDRHPGSLLPYLENIYKAVPVDAIDMLAIEDVVAPNLRMERAAYSPGPILETAIVAGYCMAFHATTVLVPPDGNGSGPLGGYPPEMVSSREQKHPNWRARLGSDSGGRYRHERSAYDIARMGYRLRDQAHTLKPATTPAQARVDRVAL